MTRMPWEKPHQDPHTVVSAASADSALDPFIRSRMCPADDLLDFGRSPDGSAAAPLRDRKVPFEEEARLAALGLQYLDLIDTSPVWHMAPFWVAPDCRIDTQMVAAPLLRFASDLVARRRSIADLPLRDATRPDVTATRQELDRLRDQLQIRVAGIYRYLQSLDQMGQMLDQYNSDLSVPVQLTEIVPSDSGDPVTDHHRNRLDLAVEAIRSAYKEVT